MIWGAFSASGKADLVVMEGKQNSFDISMFWKTSSHLCIN